MATLKDVLDAMAHIRDCTGDQSAWRAGLSPAEVNMVLVPLNAFGATPRQLDAILATIRRHHPRLFDPATGAPVTPPPPPIPASSDEPQSGATVQAIKDAEALLAQINSESAEFDRLMLEAILMAHQTTEDGKRRLDELENDIETAARSRKLDTALGAREFQRYLIGRLKDILAVVADANDSDASHTALLAALAALYSPDATSRPEPAPPGRDDLVDDTVAAEPVPGAGLDLDAIPDDGVAAFGPATPVQAVPAAPVGAPAPSLGGVPVGLPFAGPLSGEGRYREPFGLDDAALIPADPIPEEQPQRDAPEDGRSDEDPGTPETPGGPTTVTLPDGETVTVDSPQLAAVITAAADGTPIADAFRRQGIDIPPPGTAVDAPIDPAQVIPGDIGMFSDRHALAIGNSKALLDGQIQRIANVSGPSFLGWQHPPAPATTAPTATDPAVAAAPAPTAPSAAASP